MFLRLATPFQHGRMVRRPAYFISTDAMVIAVGFNNTYTGFQCLFKKRI